MHDPFILQGIAQQGQNGYRRVNTPPRPQGTSVPRGRHHRGSSPQAHTCLGRGGSGGSCCPGSRCNNTTAFPTPKGAPLPLRCKMLVSHLRHDRLLELGVPIEEDVEGHHSPRQVQYPCYSSSTSLSNRARCGNRRTCGDTTPQAQCRCLAGKLANSSVVVGVQRRVPRQEGSGPIVAL